MHTGGTETWLMHIHTSTLIMSVLLWGHSVNTLFAQGNISEDNLCALTQASNEAADKEKLDMECSSSGRHTETLDCIVSSSLSCFVTGSIVALALCTWSIFCYLSF